MPDQINKQKELQLIIFKVDKEEFALEIQQVKEIVRLIPITPVPRTPFFIEGIVNLRGQILTVIDLAKRLNLKVNSRTDKSRIIVVALEELVVGMIVDEVVEVLKLPEDSIEKHPELISPEFRHSFLKGVGKLDKRLLMLIDVANLFSQEELEDLKVQKKNE